MREFRRVGDVYVAGLDRAEREVFATVVADVAELLGAERFEQQPLDVEVPPPLVRMSMEAVAAPQDPAVRRLLPDASRDDDAVAAEFRRLTDADLRVTKIERLRDVWTALTGPQVPVPGAGIDDDEDFAVAPARAQALAAGLTDVRLVLAERLGLETEEDADRLYASLEAQATAADERAGRRAGHDGPWDGVDLDDRDDLGDPDDGRPAREILAQQVRAYLGSVYAALTWLQESLMAVLLADLGRSAD
jgi:hypothetical protein